MKVKSAAVAPHAAAVFRQRNVLQHVFNVHLELFPIDFSDWCVWSLAHRIAPLQLRTLLTLNRGHQVLLVLAWRSAQYGSRCCGTPENEKSLHASSFFLIFSGVSFHLLWNEVVVQRVSGDLMDRNHNSWQFSLLEALFLLYWHEFMNCSDQWGGGDDVHRSVRPTKDHEKCAVSFFIYKKKSANHRRMKIKCN